MSHQRWYRPLTTAATLLGAGLLGAGLLGGCSGAPPTPQATAAAYLAAWARQDWAVMQKLTSRPPADFTAVNQAAFRNLTVRQARRVLVSPLAMGLPAGTYAKTGTAQYGTTKPLKLDAWLMGFRGNVAFAALVVDSAGNGGPTCGPIVARFLRRL